MGKKKRKEKERPEKSLIVAGLRTQGRCTGAVLMVNPRSLTDFRVDLRLLTS